MSTKKMKYSQLVAILFMLDLVRRTLRKQERTSVWDAATRSGVDNGKTDVLNEKLYRSATYGKKET